MGQMVSELNAFLTGWVTYFRHAACKTRLIALDGWIRRKLPCVRLKHCRQTKTINRFLSESRSALEDLLGVGVVGQRLVAPGGQPSGQSGDGPALVCVSRIG